jgi:hypothetical protein
MEVKKMAKNIEFEVALYGVDSRKLRKAIGASPLIIEGDAVVGIPAKGYSVFYRVGEKGTYIEPPRLLIEGHPYLPEATRIDRKLRMLEAI